MKDALLTKFIHKFCGFLLLQEQLQLHLCEVPVVKLLSRNFTELPEGHREVRLCFLHHLWRQNHLVWQ